MRDSLYEGLFEFAYHPSASAHERCRKNPNFVQNIFFNRLMTFKNVMNQNQIHDSISTIVGAGFETLSNSTAHCILFLAMHPDVQDRAYEEIISVFPNDDIEITQDSLTKLNYTECVMKETLRLTPTAHVIARETMDNFDLLPGENIKKGSIIAINIYALHRNKKYWKEAEKFKPERFLEEKDQKCYIPFSSGKRNCIGYRYVIASFKIMLIKLLKNYKFTTNLKYDEIKFDRQIALKLDGKHLVMIEKR